MKEKGLSDPSIPKVRAIKRFFVILLVALWLPPCAARAAMPMPPCTPNHGTLIFIVDTSTSMHMRHKRLGVSKLALAKEFLSRFSAYLPNFPTNVGIRTFAPDKELLSPGNFDRNSFHQALQNLDAGGDALRPSNMARSIARLSKKMDDPKNEWTAAPGIILITDGQEAAGSDDLRAEILTWHKQHRPKLYIVSLADTPEGEALLAEIISIPPPSFRALWARMDTALDEDETLFNFGLHTLCRAAIDRFNFTHFDSGSSAINVSAAMSLGAQATLILENGVDSVLITGHTDNTGGERANQKLSERRAEAARQYLVSCGVPPEIIRTRGVGHGQPRHSNEEDEGRRLNRRVEIDYRISWP